MSTLAHPPRVVAVFRRDGLPRGTRPATLALWHVADPGNVGTLLRSADAFGAGVALSPGCADPTGPKALRASMGALFRVPIAGRDVLVVSPEDLILMKILSERPKDVADAEALIRRRSGELRRPVADREAGAQQPTVRRVRCSTRGDALRVDPGHARDRRRRAGCWRVPC